MYPPNLPNTCCAGFHWVTVDLGNPKFNLVFDPQIPLIPLAVWLCELRFGNRAPLIIHDVLVGNRSEFANGAPLPLQAFNVQWFEFFDKKSIDPGELVQVRGEMYPGYHFTEEDWQRPDMQISVGGVIAFEPVSFEDWTKHLEETAIPFDDFMKRR